MQFEESGGKWKPVSLDKQGRDALMSAGALLLLFAMLLAALFVVAFCFFAVVKSDHPVWASVGIFIEFRSWIGIVALWLFVMGCLYGWHIPGAKQFEHLVIEKLTGIEQRLESIEDHLGIPESRTMRPELSGVTKGLERLDRIERKIRSRD